jgi:hypothetical protein
MPRLDLITPALFVEAFTAPTGQPLENGGGMLVMVVNTEYHSYEETLD